jgi:hypothetical protein
MITIAFKIVKLNQPVLYIACCARIVMQPHSQSALYIGTIRCPYRRFNHEQRTFLYA